MDPIRNRTIYPVILPVSNTARKLKPKRRVTYLSRHARRALEISAEKSRISLGDLLQDKKGAPLPFDGTFWSVTHKTGYVGGVVAPERIGIDLEKIRSCSKNLFRKTADEKEWALAGSDKDSFTTFFRYWTSKEAVLKASGIGLKDLSKCRVVRILDDRHLKIGYQDKMWQVEHYYFNDHVASIVKRTFHIDWTIGR